MVGVVNPTISLAAPSAMSLNGSQTGNQTGVSTNLNTPTIGNTTANSSSLTLPSTNGATSNSGNSSSSNGLSVSPLTFNSVSSQDANSNNNTAEGTGQGTQLNSGSGSKSGLNAGNNSSNNSSLDPNNISDTAQKLYNLLNGSNGLEPLSESSVYGSGLDTAGAITNTDSLLSTVDLSGIGGAAADPAAASALSGGLETANAATNTDALLAGSQAGGDLGAASSGGLSGLLGGVSGYAAPLGGGLLAGGLLGGAVGSPGGGAAAGAAGGAATGAAIGSIIPGPGTVVGAVVGGLAGLFGGLMGGQHPTVGPDGNTSIQGWNAQTNAPNFVSGQDNGGSASQSQQVANQGWDAVQTILKNLGGTATGATGIDVGTFKGQFTVGNPGTGYVDTTNPSEKVSGSETANTFNNSNNAEAEFIAQQLNYIGQNGKASGLSQDQLNQLSKVSYQDVLDGNVPGMPKPQSNSTTTNTTGPTDWGAIGAANNANSVPGFDRGGFVEGKGGPRDDKVPAKLSHEEFVIPADVVDRLGGGDGTNRDHEASQRGARSLVQLIDAVRGPDAGKYGRPKNVDGADSPHFGLGGGMFSVDAGPSNMTSNQNRLSQGGSVSQIYPTSFNDNVTRPSAGDGKDSGYGFGGLIPRPGNNSNNFAAGGEILKGMTNYKDGGMTPWPNNNFHDGGLVHDNMSNDVEQPPSSFKKANKFKQRQFNSGYDAHGISQDLGMEGNYGHNYAKGGFVVDESTRPSRRGSYAKDNYNRGGLVKRPAQPTAPNATFYN